MNYSRVHQTSYRTDDLEPAILSGFLLQSVAIELVVLLSLMT